MKYPVVQDALDGSVGLIGGKFSDGDEETNTLASVARAVDMNQVFDELENVIVWGGGAPDETVFTQVRDFIIAGVNSMLDTNDPNPLINGDMQIAQRPAANINSSAFQFGTVDRWACKATGTITGGGAITQAITTLLGSGGFALQISNLSASTAGSVIARHRVESATARRYKNAVSIIKQVIVYQDTGANQNYTIAINKANAQDNFSSVTNVGTSGNIVVPSGVPTVISFALAPGDVSNGIEFQITANFAAAIAGKNFYFTDAQLHNGSRVRANCNHPAFPEALTRCQWYFRNTGSGVGGVCVNTGVMTFGMDFPAMRAAPTFSGIAGVYTAAIANTPINCTSNTPTSAFQSSTGVIFNIINFSGLTTGQGCVLESANVATLDSEL